MSLGTVEYSLGGTGVAVVLEVTAKNVSNEAACAYFIGGVVSAYQDDKMFQVAYELLDETTPIELEAGTIRFSEGRRPYCGLTNPQTVDHTTL